jgi:hypothetical protein
MMTVDVTGKLCGPSCVVRLRTNMQVFWDRIFVAPVVDRVPAAVLEKPARANSFRVTPLDLSDAVLETPGCAQEFTPDGRRPTIYNRDRIDSVPVTNWTGNLTRTGSVTELLTARDDRFVIMGPGDEITARFDAGRLPPLPSGWQRSFVLCSFGYSKDSGPFTAAGGAVEPFPFQAMSSYPYPAGEHYPQDAFHGEYQRCYNTRKMGAR